MSDLPDNSQPESSPEPVQASSQEPVPEVKLENVVDESSPTPDVVVPPNSPRVSEKPAGAVAEPSKPKRTPPNDLRLTTDQVEAVVSCIKDVLDGRKPSAGALLRIVANCLECTSKMKLKPDLSKKLISHSLEAFLREPENDLDEDEVQTLMAAADVTISEGVDVLVDVHKGNINLSNKSCCVIV
jgi:hypothetical protein